MDNKDIYLLQTLLVKIRELLLTLSQNELLMLEKILCSSEELIQTSLSDVEISEDEESECAGETSECETVMEAIQKDNSHQERSRSAMVRVLSNGLKENVNEPITYNSKGVFSASSRKDEESNSLNSGLDSGLGTNQTNSEPESLSDKLPDSVNMRSHFRDLEPVDNSSNDPINLESSPSSSRLNDSLSVSVLPSQSDCCNSDIPKCSDSCDTDSVEQLPVQSSGFLNMNGHWTLPVITCSCSHAILIDDEASMSHQGLINRGVSQDDVTYISPCTNPVMCNECSQNKNLREDNIENMDDVRWEREVPGTSDSWQKSRTSDSPEQNVIFTEKTVNIVDSSDTANIILQNSVPNTVVTSENLLNSDKVNKLQNSIIQNKSAQFNENSWTKNRRNNRGEPSVDFQVRYADNWQALRHSTELANDEFSSKSKFRDAPSSLSSSCSSCHSICSVPSDSYSLSSDTSSFNSEYQDEEEVALAVRAAEVATRQEARAKFRSSADLIHRLFVCIAGVADQLQTNFAGDLRNILKSVFLINASNKTEMEELDDSLGDCCENGEEALVWGENEGQATNDVEVPPAWVPDEAAPTCMACQAPFTVVRRRHHCRNCGKIFCARCSSNSVPLPRFGHLKPVRVCNRCFIYQVTPFMIDQISTSVS